MYGYYDIWLLISTLDTGSVMEQKIPPNLADVERVVEAARGERSPGLDGLAMNVTNLSLSG